MSLSSVANTKMPKRRNSRQRALGERQLRKRRRRAMNANENQMKSSVLTQSTEKPTRISVYDRYVR